MTYPSSARLIRLLDPPACPSRALRVADGMDFLQEIEGEKTARPRKAQKLLKYGETSFE